MLEGGGREKRGGKARRGDTEASLSESEVRAHMECVCPAGGGSRPEGEDSGSTASSAKADLVRKSF